MTQGKKEKTVIKVSYKPRRWAQKFHKSTMRWKVLVCHRRAGKTTACINHLIRDAVSHQGGGRYAYIAPTYKQAKAVAWDMLKEYSSTIPSRRINESELRIDFPHNNSRIQLFGADNYDSLRGLGLDGAVFDEYSQQPAAIFTEVVSKCLADKLGYAIWIGTPKGRNAFYEIFNQSQQSENWYGRLLTIDESLEEETGETIENLRVALEDDKKLVKQAVMTEDQFQQEWYCSFDAAIIGAYYAKELSKARKEGRINKVPYKPEIRVDTYWDLGVSDTMCIIFAQTIGREVHIIDFYYNNGMALSHYIDILDKRDYLYGVHNFPHDIRVTEMQTGRSRYEMVRNLLDPHNRGKINTVPNLSLEEGINAGRAFFQRCWFDQSKCSYLLDAIGSYAQEWDIKKGMFKDKPSHNWASHPADAFRYLCVGYRDKVEIKHYNAGMSKYISRKPARSTMKAIWD